MINREEPNSQELWADFLPLSKLFKYLSIPNYPLQRKMALYNQVRFFRPVSVCFCRFQGTPECATHRISSYFSIARFIENENTPHVPSPPPDEMWCDATKLFLYSPVSSALGYCWKWQSTDLDKNKVITKNIQKTCSKGVFWLSFEFLGWEIDLCSVVWWWTLRSIVINTTTDITNQSYYYYTLMIKRMGWI